jgi:type I restriction enzyme S subunit
MESDWIRRTVGELIEAHYSGPSPTCEERQVRSDDEWGLLKTTAITWENGWDWRQHKVPPASYWGQTQIEVRRGDVLVTKAGPRHRVGVIAYVSATPPHLMASGKMIGLRPKDELVVPQVLASALSTAEPQRFLDHRTTGMAESQVNFANSTLLATSLALPPLAEQRRIADVLDALDEAIDRTQQLISKLQQMKQGLLHDLLTRGIGDKAELRDPVRHAEEFADSQTGLRPATWRISPLGSELTLQRGFDITVAEQRPGDIPVVSSSGITSYNNRAMVDGPGVVTGRKGKLGAVYYVEGPFWPHDTTLWVKDFHGNDPRFAALLLGAMRLERFDAATSVPTLNRNFVHPLLVAVPPVAEQERIVDVIDGLDSRVALERTLLRKLRLLKGGLRGDLLTGRVRVTNLLEDDAT